MEKGCCPDFNREFFVKGNVFCENFLKVDGIQLIIIVFVLLKSQQPEKVSSGEFLFSLSTKKRNA